MLSAVCPRGSVRHYWSGSNKQLESLSRKGIWLLRMRSLASVIENQPPRSTSENSIKRPDRDGHSSWQRLLVRLRGSQSPSKAHTETTFPPACFTTPSSRKLPCTAKPVSSWHSRVAASKGCSPSTYSPLGIDHAPRSLFAQNGPPRWTRKTSKSRLRRRYI